MATQRIVVIGGAGQARGCVLRRRRQPVAPTFSLAGFVVSDVGRPGANDSKEHILGDFSWIEKHIGDLDGTFSVCCDAASSRELNRADFDAGRVTRRYEELYRSTVASREFSLGETSAGGRLT
jgi:hypothetical protein